MNLPVTPLLAVDGIIEVYDDVDHFKGIVLIERKNKPLGLAFPGGFVDVGESVESALIREMKEETRLDVATLKLLSVFSNPDRDPRFHVVSIVFTCKAKGTPEGADDAKLATLYKPEDIPKEKLVFDHKLILECWENQRLQKEG